MVPISQPFSSDLVSRRVGNYQFVATSGALVDQMWVR